MDPAPVLTHGDMGMAMDHSMHDRPCPSGRKQPVMAGMKCGAAMMAGMDRSQHDMATMGQADGR